MSVDLAMKNTLFCFIFQQFRAVRIACTGTGRYAFGNAAFLLCFLLAILFGTAVPLQAAPSPKTLQDAYARVAEKAMPAVVTIFSLKYNGLTYQKNGVGSGFLISADGFIVTNHHVIEDSDALVVQVSTGEKVLAKVIGTSKAVDLAVLKVETSRCLPYLKFTDTASVKVGHYAIAIGAPFALSQTMTTGIVSHKGRSLGMNYKEDFIQTDAAINPGNSGGPLLNIDGDVIGVNDCIVSRSGNSAGVGFAIDGNLAKKTVLTIIRAKSSDRPYAGIVMEDNHTNTARPIISEIVSGSPAEKAGLQKGDLILQIGSRKISTVRDALSVILSDYEPGDKAVFIVRRGNEQKKIELKFAKPR